MLLTHLGRTGIALAAFAVCAVAPILPAAAQDFPAKAIKVVVPFPAGGAMDVATRVVTAAMEHGLSVPMVVENKPGASGNIGTVQVVQSVPDGHTLLLGIAANTAINRFLYDKLPFDADRDLVPIGQFGSSTNVIYVAPSFSASTVAELLAHLKRAPGKENYVTPGIGTTPHLAMELLKKRTGTFVVHVPFRGSAAAIAAVLGGEVPIGVDAIVAAAPAIRSGKVTPLAVTSAERSSVLSDVPTLRELGHDIDASTYLGLFAPAKTPPAIVQRLTKELEAALKKDETRARLRNLGIEPVFAPKELFARRISSELPMWKEAVSYSGAKNY